MREARRHFLQFACLNFAAAALGQTPPGSGPLPGEGISRREFPRGGLTPGYFQPVKLLAPPWIQIAWAAEGHFVDPRPAPLTVGLLMQATYRFLVRGIPGQEELAIYPTVQVLDRLYAPAGQAARFPIPVEIAVEDLRLAAAGQLVTRVAYVEDPQTALPVQTNRDRPTWFDAGSGADPWQEAKQYGRPLAVLRMGGRQPLAGELADSEFLGACPPLIIFQNLADAPPPEPASARRDPGGTR